MIRNLVLMNASPLISITTQWLLSDDSNSGRQNKLNLTIRSTDVNVANTSGVAFSLQVSLWGSVSLFRLLTKAASEHL